MRRRTPSTRNGTVDLITPDELTPNPYELVHGNGAAPDSIAGWKALADSLLTNQSCAFHRNLEISSRYAWIYKLLPAYLKWAGMAAFASHHVRLALFPLRLDTDRTGYVDIAHSLARQKVLLIQDVNTIRETNNAIFDDIFWVHLAYGTPKTASAVYARSWERSPTTLPSSPASRRSTKDAVSWRLGQLPRRADGRPTISFGTATSSSSSTSNARWCNPTSIASRARSPGCSPSARL
jgi:Protein of unknown function (DUF2515)